MLICRATKKATRPISASSTTTKRTNSTGSKGPGEGGGGVAKTFLSVEQQQVLAKVVADGQNIFFTGSAGESPRTTTLTKLIDRNR
jgi:hypothetical protein